LFGAVGDFLGEVAFGELTPDGFVLFTVDLLIVGEGEGEVDEAVIEEGGTVFEGVCHGVFVLTDERPVGKPVGILAREKAIQFGF